jgi:hypothetical protein
MKTRLFVIIGAASIAVCTTPVAPCACEPQRTHVVIYGTVRTAAGASMAGSPVFVVAVPLGGPVVNATELQPSGTTATNGHYRVESISFYAPATPLTVKGAAVNVAGDTARAETVGGSLRPWGQPPDSVQLDLVFP